MTTQSTSLRLADNISTEPFAFPGGYPRFAVTEDGSALCHKCCKSERESIGTTTGHDGWCVLGSAINWEDPELFCDHCGARIESAYAEEIHEPKAPVIKPGTGIGKAPFNKAALGG